jgi:hypothetical protein
MNIRRFILIPLLAFIFVNISTYSSETKGKVVEAAPPKVTNPIDTTSVCLNRVNIREEDLHWVYAPESASELRTEVDYFFLAGQLIINHVVDASSCPAGGLGAVYGYANACGMSAARSIVIEIQNAYDEAILAAWRDVGVPPVLLKQLFRYESQFWPVQFDPNHFGNGHMTYVGAYTALQWNFLLNREICTLAYGADKKCDVVDDVMVGTLLGLMNASCPTCPYKIDIEKGQKSVYYIAESLLGYCNQTTQLVSNATFRTPSSVVDYATIWKLTLFNYNVGPTCVYNAVMKAYEAKQGAIRWNDIVPYVSDAYCQRGVYYANRITEKFYNFTPK